MKRLLLGMALSATLAMAQAQVGDLKAYLGLSDTQESSLKQIRADARRDLEPLRKSIQEKVKAIRQQSNAGDTSATALGQLMIDVQNARKQLEPIRMRAHDQAMAVLTPDQQAKVAQLVTGAKRGRELRQAARLGLLNLPAQVRDRARARGRKI